MPACTSPWNVPHRIVVSRKPLMTSCTTGAGSYPYFDTVVRSSTGTPSRNSMVRTRRTGELREHLGHRHPAQFHLVEQPAVVGERPGLVAQVELLAELGPEPLEHRDELARRVLPGLLGDQLQQRLEEVEVGRDPVLDAGTQHLDRDSTAVAGGGLVHDRDRCPADRRLGEAPERLVEAHPEVALDDGTNLVEGDHGAGVEARPELLGHGLTEHAGRRSDQLAELHERRAEILEGAAQRTGVRIGRHVPAEGGPQHQRREVAGGDEADLSAAAHHVDLRGPGQGQGEHARHGVLLELAQSRQCIRVDRGAGRSGGCDRVRANGWLGGFGRHRAPCRAGVPGRPGDGAILS